MYYPDIYYLDPTATAPQFLSTSLNPDNIVEWQTGQAGPGLQWPVNSASGGSYICQEQYSNIYYSYGGYTTKYVQNFMNCTPDYGSGCNVFCPTAPTLDYNSVNSNIINTDIYSKYYMETYSKTHQNLPLIPYNPNQHHYYYLKTLPSNSPNLPVIHYIHLPADNNTPHTIQPYHKRNKFSNKVMNKKNSAIANITHFDLYKIANMIDLLYEYLKGTVSTLGRPILLTPKPSHRSPGLEVIWQEHFKLLFGLLKGKWVLKPSESSNDDHKDAILFKDNAKVRFSCQKCAKGWTSMFGVVLFYYWYNRQTDSGHITFKLMGQSCIRCNQPGVFETPMWYPEEAQKVLTNLFYSIWSKVYGQQAPPLCKIRRAGRPRHQHNADQCQGCYLHLCKPAKKLSEITSSEEPAKQITESSAADTAS